MWLSLKLETEFRDAIDVPSSPSEPYSFKNKWRDLQYITKCPLLNAYPISYWSPSLYTEHILSPLVFLEYLHPLA